MFRIEARRDIGLWFFPALLFLAYWFPTHETPDDRPATVQWLFTSSRIGMAGALLAPFAGGLAAWAAGRDHRRGMSDLLATTPRPASMRDVLNWMASAGWSLLACLAVTGFLGVEAVREATWGSPALSLIVVGFVTVLNGAALGYLAGALLPSRFVPPLVPIALFAEGALLQGQLFSPSSANLTSWTFLTPSQRDVFTGVSPDLGLPLTLWLLGLAGVAMALLAVRWRRSVASWGALTATAAVTLLGANLLLGMDVEQRGQFIPYTPVCARGVIPVCVHPAYEKHLDETTESVGRIVEPLVGLPGGPARAEQAPVYAQKLDAEGTLRFNADRLDLSLVVLLVRGAAQPDSTAAWPPWGLTSAQNALARWLAQRVDIDPRRLLLTTYSYGPAETPATQELEAEIAAAAERFAALDPAAQHAWLAAHLVDLRGGAIALEDLP